MTTKTNSDLNFNVGEKETTSDGMREVLGGKRMEYKSKFVLDCTLQDVISIDINIALYHLQSGKTHSEKSAERQGGCIIPGFEFGLRAYVCMCVRVSVSLCT